jgi:zona occludens toxin (predicted ATPase)
VEDAKTAISQLRFQTMNKLDVSLDQSQLAHAFKEAPIKDTPVLIASQDKLLMSLTQTETPVSHQLHAWEHNKSPLELTELVAVDAKLANSQDNSQILPEPDVSIDHSPFVVAQRDNQLMDIHAKHAQPVKLLNKTTKSNAILQPAQEITK